MEKQVDIAVFGSVFVDIKGFPRDVLIPKGTNVGSVKFKHGGVSRNVVENLSFMGLRTRFVSMVDNSALGMEVLARLKNEGVDTEFVRIVEKDGMGMWLVVLDEKGDIAASVSHQPDLRPLYEMIDESCDYIVDSADAVVLDLDLDGSYIERIAETAHKYNKRVYAALGNLDVVKRNREIFNHFDCLICNNIEFGIIAGKEMEDAREILESAKGLTERGLKRIVVTMGKGGSIYYDGETGEEGHVPVEPVEVIDTTGAGDAFFAGTVFGLLEGYKLSRSIEIGTKAASLTISCNESTNPEIKNAVRSGRL